MPQPLMKKGDCNTNNPTTITFQQNSITIYFRQAEWHYQSYIILLTSDMALLAYHLPDVNHLRFLINKLHIFPKQI